MRLQDGETFLEMASGRLEGGTSWVRADLVLQLEPSEPLAWAESLELLVRQGYGAETFRSYSGQFQTTFAMAKKDELHISFLLQDAPDFLHELRLFFNLPQSELPRIIGELRKVFAA